MASATINYSFPYPQNTDSVDVAGDIRRLAEYVDENINQIIYDNVGLMVVSNSENGISVVYDDSDNTLDFITNNFIISMDGAVSGSATVTELSNTDIETVARDFNITLSNSVSGSATVSNLSDVDIPVVVSDDSHIHTSSTITSLNIDDISDVNISSIQDGEAVIYNSTSGLWENTTANRRIFISEISDDLTIGLEDAGKTILSTTSSSVQIIIPNSSSVSFMSGYNVSFIRYGPGDVFFEPSSGVNLNSKTGNYSISSQYGIVKLMNISENTWILTGDLS